MATKVKLIADGVITPDQITLTTASSGTNTTAPATTAFVQQEISALVDSSPDALNTLNELAAALGDDANFSTTVTNSIATKLPLAGGTLTGNLNIIGGAADMALIIRNSASGTSSSDGLSITVENPTPDVAIRQRENANMKFLTNNAEAMRIDNNQNLLVGVTSTTLAGDSITLPNSGIIGFHDAGGSARNVLQFVSGELKHGAAGGGLTSQTFFTSATERMRINSSGALLLGTTNTTLYSANSGGGIYAVPNGSTTIARQSTGSTQPLFILNETGVDGTLQEFRKDGSVVGSIGTKSSGLYIGTDDAGIFFNHHGGGDLDAVIPYDIGTSSFYNGHVNLGASGGRFKDLYLSGTANTSGLSVDGGTIKLDGNYPVGSNNVALGDTALDSLTSGANNVAVGHIALTSNTTGSANVAVGANALDANTTAGNNTAVGFNSMTLTTEGGSNTALGSNSLASNTTGSNNTAVGRYAMQDNTTGIYNTAVGWIALGDNITGNSNTAVGMYSLRANTASENTALGYKAMYVNSTGTSNVAVGSFALDANTTGSYNTTVGMLSLTALTTGGSNTTMGYASGQGLTGASSFNVAIGDETLLTSGEKSYNTAVGSDAMRACTTGSANVGVGYNSLAALTTGTNNVAMGSGSLDANTTGGSNTAIGENALTHNTTASNNTAVGKSALQDNTTGTQNVAVGTGAADVTTTAHNVTAVGYFAMGAATSANQVTALGSQSLYNNQGLDNTGAGYATLFNNTSGQNNAAFGSECLENNTTASNNTGVGYRALRANTTGAYNIAIGSYALDATVTANYNVAIGYEALSAGALNSNVAIGHQAMKNNTDNYNVAVGTQALTTSTTTTSSTAIGAFALYSNTTGDNNTAVGRSALEAHTTGSNHTAIGNGALTTLTTGARNTALGHNAGEALTTADDNTLIGEAAGGYITTGNDSVCVGRLAAGYTVQLTTGTRCVFVGSYTTPSSSSVSNEAVIGYGVVGKGGNTTFLQGSGGTFNGANSSTFSTTSDRRIKKNIEDNNTGLEAINKIQVKNFEYRTLEEITDFDNPRAAVVNKEGVQLGVIAQEIETILPDVVREETTGVKTVDPSNLTWYLVNAVQELSAKIEELETKLENK
jgi:hypothetical protein